MLRLMVWFCMTLIVFWGLCSVGPSKIADDDRSYLRLSFWDCARVDSVGGFGYCKLISLTTDGVLC